MDSSLLKGLGDLARALRRDANLLQETSALSGEPAADRGRARERQHVSERLDIAPVAAQRVPPGDVIANVGQVLLVFDLEPHVLEGLTSDAFAVHLGDAIADLDAVRDLAVERVGLVELVGEHPLVNAEGSTGLQHAEDLAVHALQNGGMHGGLDSVHGIERVVREVHLHKVALDEVQLVSHVVLGRPVVGALDLVVVVVETSDLAVREPRDLPGRATDTAANIEDLHTGLDVHLGSKVVLVTRSGLAERLALVVTREVERRAPAVLVEVGDEVIIVLCERRVVLKSLLLVRLSLGLRISVVPVAEVAVNGSRVGLAILADDGTEAAVLAVAMHGLGKLLILGVLLRRELDLRGFSINHIFSLLV